MPCWQGLICKTKPQLLWQDVERWADQLLYSSTMCKWAGREGESLCGEGFLKTCSAPPLKNNTGQHTFQFTELKKYELVNMEGKLCRISQFFQRLQSCLRGRRRLCADKLYLDFCEKHQTLPLPERQYGQILKMFLQPVHIIIIIAIIILHIMILLLQPARISGNVVTG